MLIKSMLNGRVLTALVMLAIFVTMSLLALDFPAKGRLMPLMIAVPASVLALVQLILDFRTVVRTTPDPEKAQKAREEKKVEIRMFFWTFLFFIGILCFGFVYASPVLVFLYLYVGSKESLTVSILGVVGTWLVTYVTFEKWFRVPLFSGLIIEWLFG